MCYNTFIEEMEDFKDVAGSNLEFWYPELTEQLTASVLCVVLFKGTYVLDVLICVIVLGSTASLVSFTSDFCVLRQYS